MRGATGGEAKHRTRGTLLRVDEGLEVEAQRLWDRSRAGSERGVNDMGAGSFRKGGWLRGERTP
jgi:hypothetical protein